jgi:tight adherence protein B
MNPIIILWVGGALILIIIGIGVFANFRTRKSSEEERIGDYTTIEQPEEITSKKNRQAIVTDWISKRVEKSTYGDRLAKELAQADLKLKPGEYVTAMITASLAVGIVGYFLGSNSIILALAGAVGGLFLPSLYVKIQKSRRLIKFSDQLGDMLGLMVNGLRAGYSTLQAMESVSKELPAPISDEFRRVVQEIQLGVTTEKALENLLRRIPSDDLDLVITAMNVQREVGGNLAEILETISHTIRERVKLKGEIRVLTSQQRITGLFLAILPIGLALALYVINRDYVMEFFAPENNSGPVPCGYVSAATAVLMIVIGYLVMMKLGQIDV